MKKKLLSALMTTMILFAVQAPTPAHADDALLPDKGIKVETCRLDGADYYNLSIVDNKLIAKGKWARNTDPSQFKVQLQITPPVTHDDASVDGDGLATMYVGNKMLKTGPHWELETTIPVVKSVECQGAKSIELAIPLSGLADGVYNLRELVTQGDKYESYFGDMTCVVVHWGQANLQIFHGEYCSGLTQYNNSGGFWIS